jgi:hypothetical protein
LIVAGFPIALRELHHLARGWLRMRALGPGAAAGTARLNFLYFSYAPDFTYLQLSLKTLAHAVPAELVGRVVLAEDQKAPFSEEQKSALLALAPSLHVVPVHDFEWGSPRSTHAELQIFKQVCSLLGDAQDLLVKVDSDVLFVRNPKWLRLLRSSAQAIGDAHYLQHRFAQGGLYMIRRHIVDAILAKVTLGEVEQVARAIDSVGEDMAISQLLADKGQPFFFTRMMLFPEEYRLLPHLNSWVRSEFLALHCHKDKRNMAALTQQYGLLDNAGSAS